MIKLQQQTASFPHYHQSQKQGILLLFPWSSLSAADLDPKETAVIKAHLQNR